MDVKRMPPMYKRAKTKHHALKLSCIILSKNPKKHVSSTIKCMTPIM